MPRKDASFIGGRAVIAALSLTLYAGTANTQERFEAPSLFSASQLLPPEAVAGPNHRVRERVQNDGFLYIYTIDSKYGPLTAVSTATLYKRIGELNAMAGMERVKGTEEFMSGMQGKAGAVVEGGVDIVTDPLGAASGAVSGVASIFKNVGSTMKYGRSETESGSLSVVSAYDKAKRRYANEFGVDPYSRNEYLQKELNELARAGWLGESVVRVGTAAVGGTAGAAVSSVSITKSLNTLLLEKSAGALRVHNEEKLKAIGVSDDVIEFFMKNRTFTMSQQTAIVLALDSMPRTANRVAFVKFAALTDEPDMAAFRRRQAEMYAEYNRAVKPIVAFEYLGQIATARTDDGGIVFNAPLDHALWTQDLGPFVRWVDGRLDGLPNVARRELLVGGTLSELTRENFAKLGWKVTERAQRILPPS